MCACVRSRTIYGSNIVFSSSAYVENFKQINYKSIVVALTLKTLNKFVAADILKFILLFFSEKKDDISCESSTR